MKSPASLYSSLYSPAAYSAAAAAYSSITPMQLGTTPTTNQSSPTVGSNAPPGHSNSVKSDQTTSPLSGSTCGGRGPWPSSHSVTDLLGHMGGLPRHHHHPHHHHHHQLGDTSNYNNYMYYLQCGQTNPPLTHNQLSSPLANSFHNPLTHSLPNGIQNAFSNPLSSMMGGAGLTPQSATL